jgi:hypothetical protein
VSTGDAIFYAVLLLLAYGLGRFIRYQRWSPEPIGPWEMTYERGGITWDWTCKRFDGKNMDTWAMELGSSLTYRAAVRRSRRAAFLADRKVTVKY